MVENGALSSMLPKLGGKMPEPLVSKYIAQVLKGLHYLHSQGVIHRDIKVRVRAQRLRSVLCALCAAGDP